MDVEPCPQALPAALVKLPKLSTLIGSHNSITALPEGLSKLSMLTDLQLSHCSLTAVPQELASVPKLKTLVLDPNPFDDRKLTKVLKEGRLKNILTHIKKNGAPPSKEATEAAAAALRQLELAAAQQRLYELLPVDKAAQLDVYVHPDVKSERCCAADVAFVTFIRKRICPNAQCCVHAYPCVNMTQSLTCLGPRLPINMQCQHLWGSMSWYSNPGQDGFCCVLYSVLQVYVLTSFVQYFKA